MFLIVLLLARCPGFTWTGCNVLCFGAHSGYGPVCPVGSLYIGGRSRCCICFHALQVRYAATVENPEKRRQAELEKYRTREMLERKRVGVHTLPRSNKASCRVLGL